MEQFPNSQENSELFSRIEYLEEEIINLKNLVVNKIINLENRVVNVEYDVEITNSNLRDQIQELECFPNPYSDEGEANCNFDI